jgi:hypothetical protein
VGADKKAEIKFEVGGIKNYCFYEAGYWIVPLVVFSVMTV